MRILAILPLAAICYAQQRGADRLEFFETRVRPVLAKNCFSCHTQSKLGGLEMVSRDSLLKGGNSGPAILPDNAEESLLVKAIRQTHEKIKMPPTGKLADKEIADIVEWIGRGAVWPPAPAAASKGYQITQ